MSPNEALQAMKMKAERMQGLEYFRAHQHLAAAATRLQQSVNDVLAAGAILSQIAHYDTTHLSSVTEDMQSLTNRLNRETQTLQQRANKVFLVK